MFSLKRFPHGSQRSFDWLVPSFLVSICDIIDCMSRRSGKSETGWFWWRWILFVVNYGGWQILCASYGYLLSEETHWTIDYRGFLCTFPTSRTWIGFVVTHSKLIEMQISYYAPGNVRLLIFLQYQSFDSIYSDFFLLEVMNVLSFFTPPSIHFHYFLSHLSSRLLLSSSLSVAIAKLIIAITTLLFGFRLPSFPFPDYL